MGFKKLNLGSGDKRIDGFINVDKFDLFDPDVVHDLEITPYPFEESSVDHIIMSHVLEHLGQDPDTYSNIIKEIYRVCCDQAVVEITAPHPRHDTFIADPTHVRPVTALGLKLLNREKNEQWLKEGQAYLPLGMILDVDFRIMESRQVLDWRFAIKVREQSLSDAEISDAAAHQYNVIQESYFKLQVVKR